MKITHRLFRPDNADISRQMEVTAHHPCMKVPVCIRIKMHDLFQRMDAAMAETGKASDWVDVELTDASGSTVVKARFQIAARDFRGS